MVILKSVTGRIPFHFFVLVIINTIFLNSNVQPSASGINRLFQLLKVNGILVKFPEPGCNGRQSDVFQTQEYGISCISASL
jgi:hypothetical protein